MYIYIYIYIHMEAALVRNAADAPAVVKTKAEEEILAKGEELRRKAVSSY